MNSKHDIKAVFIIEAESGRSIYQRTYAKGFTGQFELLSGQLSGIYAILNNEMIDDRLKSVDTEDTRFIWVKRGPVVLMAATALKLNRSYIKSMLITMYEFFEKIIKSKNMTIEDYLKYESEIGTGLSDLDAQIDELVSQFEQIDENVVAKKSMDSLEVYEHLFYRLLKMVSDEQRVSIINKIKEMYSEQLNKHIHTRKFIFDKNGIALTNFTTKELETFKYREIRNLLENMLKDIAFEVRKTIGDSNYRNELFNLIVPYIKEDWVRIRAYAIDDDIIYHVF